MAGMNKLSIFAAVLSFLTGCSQTVDHKGKTPLVEVGHDFLYKEDLQSAMPPGLRGEDSTRFAEEYIHNWVEDILLYRKAEGNIPDNVKVDELVASYRRALIMHVYQEELVNQKLGSNISDEEIEEYYKQNGGMFQADQPYIQGLFIKVPLNTPHLNNLRSWYRKNTQDAIDKIEKFSVGNAIVYDYFYDRWKPVSDFAVKMPLKALDSDVGYLDRNRNVELRDTAFCYFLHVEKFLPKGERLPLEYAKNEIKEILVNLKRVEFINEMKENLYKEASDDKDIIYY